VSNLPKARGKRPAFSDDPIVDSLTSMVLALAAEISVLRERLDTVERVAEAKGVLSRAELDAYRATQAVDAEREQWRAEFLDRVLRSVQARLEEATAGETAESYDKAVQEISELTATVVNPTR